MMSLFKILFAIVYSIISFIYAQFIKIMRYLYHQLGYHTSEHELAKAVLQMSDDCPKKYLIMVMLLYSMVYTGCSECTKAGKEVFDSLHKSLKQVEIAHDQATGWSPGGYFIKIQDILKKFKNKIPITDELLLNLKDKTVILPKEFRRNLQSYFRFWLMASSLYCPHYQTLTVNNNNNTPNQKFSSKKREAGHSKSYMSASSKTYSKFTKRSSQIHTNKPKKHLKSLPPLERAKKCLSYPMSLLYALQSLPGRRLGQQFLEDHTTLDVHVISSNPLFDSENWESFMHQLPKLTELNLVFVIQKKSFINNFNPSNLEVKNHGITCSVKQMYYHMYFSSADYTDPDVVVVYDNTSEMSASEEDDIHSKMSYRNMTLSKNTILVLMDATKDLVSRGIRAVNAARLVDQQVFHHIDPIMGLNSNQVALDFENEMSWTKKKYYTCLKRK
ncbi:unnamed protein product [Meganyctiphanes norvegica]|uniref:Mitochondrial splicing suppressor 51-like C-terminal domain-containing protein n=1 Tax=Meganyctiphanes norvegica TaxID=48144 RepID=A0AAV2R9K6_MEGNR